MAERDDAWAAAMESPNIAWAAADLLALARRVEDAADFTASMHTLVERAADADLTAHAHTAACALWQLAGGMATVAHRLEDAGEAIGRG